MPDDGALSAIGRRTPVIRSVKSRSSLAAYFTDGDASGAWTIAYSGAYPRTARLSVPAQVPSEKTAANNIIPTLAAIYLLLFPPTMF